MRRRFDTLTKTDRLLIACDFDGTIAPIVARPDLAAPNPAVMASLRTAAELPDTWVAVVSGRSMADLRQRLGDAPRFWLVGGHGASISGSSLEIVPEDKSIELDIVARLLLRTAPESKGFLHERKPASIAVHFRGVDPRDADRIVPILTHAIAGPAGLRVKHGKMVVEYLAIDADKGKALSTVRDAVGATGVVYIGDDHTDEDAFKILDPTDAGIKIGDHPTVAEFVTASIEEAQSAIIDLVRLRTQRVTSTVDGLTGTAVPGGSVAHNSDPRETSVP